LDDQDDVDDVFHLILEFTVMIDLKNAYNESGQLDFQCEYCDHHHNHFTVNLSVFLYGIAFLKGKEEAYTGFTCPSCLKTILLHNNNPTQIKYSLIGQSGPRGTPVRPVPQYYSSLVFSPKQVKDLQDFEIHFFAKDIEFTTEAEGFHFFLNSYLEEKPFLEKGYLCSYLYSNELPIGTVASVWWLKANDIEKLVKIENEPPKTRVFPRHFCETSFFERYDHFCWKYKLYHDCLRYFDDSDEDDATYKFLESMANRFQEAEKKDVQAASEFLDLLINYNPELYNDAGVLTVPFKSLWKSIAPFLDDNVPDSYSGVEPDKFKPDLLDAQIREIADEIRNYSNSKYVQEWLNKNYSTFIDEYVSLSQQSDFSYGYVWDLKCSYLKQLHSILGKAAIQDAQYVFVKEGNEWFLKFEGKPIRGLRNKGFQYIYYLVANKGKEKDVFSLGSLDGDSINSISSQKKEKSDDDGYAKKDSDKEDVANSADKETKELYQKLIEEKKREKQDAKRLGDKEMYKEADKYLKSIKEQYNKDFYKGKPRKFDDGTHKDRKRIAKSIERAITEIRGKKPLDRNPFREKVWLHFNEALRPISLYDISYSPKEDIDWFLG